MASAHLRFYIYTLLATGLLPLALDMSNYRARQSARAVWYSCFWAAFCCSLNIFSFSVHFILHFEQFGQQTTLMFSLTLAFLVGAIRTFVMYFIHIRRRHECIRLVNEAQHIWTVFRQLEPVSDGKPTAFLDANGRNLVKWKCAAVTSQLAFISVAMFWYDFGELHDVRLRFVVKVLMIIGTDLMELIYTNLHFVVTLLVLQFFRTINVRLDHQVQLVREMVQQQKSTATRMKLHYSITEDVDRLAVLYNEVSEFANRAIAVLAIPLVLVLMNAFLYLLVALYSLVHDIGKLVDFERQDHPPQILYSCMSLAFSALQVYFLVWISNAVIEESHRTGRILCRTASFQIDKETKECVEMFSLRILQSTGIMVACGMLSVDKTLVYGMVGALTSYLTILIQFDLAGNSVDKADNNTNV